MKKQDKKSKTEQTGSKPRTGSTHPTLLFMEMEGEPLTVMNFLAYEDTGEERLDPHRLPGELDVPWEYLEDDRPPFVPPTFKE